MSKKKNKHQKQVNIEIDLAKKPEKTEQRSPAIEDTVAFDTAFSSALQKLLEHTEQEPSAEAEIFPILQVPEGTRASEQKTQEASASVRDKTDKPQPEQEAYDDLLSTFSHSPINPPEDSEQPQAEFLLQFPKKTELASENPQKSVEENLHSMLEEVAEEMPVLQAAPTEEPMEDMETPQQAQELREKKHRLFHRKKPLENTAVVAEETDRQAPEQVSEQIQESQPPEDVPNGLDTQQLLSQIDALLGESAVPTPAARLDAATVRFTPIQEPKTPPLPTEVSITHEVPPEQPYSSFWQELDALKELVGQEGVTQPEQQNAAAQTKQPEPEILTDTKHEMKRTAEHPNSKQSKERSAAEDKKTTVRADAARAVAAARQSEDSDEPQSKPHKKKQPTEPKSAPKPKKQQHRLKDAVPTGKPDLSAAVVVDSAAVTAAAAAAGAQLTSAPKRHSAEVRSAARAEGRQTEKKPVQEPPQQKKKAKKEKLGLRPDEAYKSYTQRLGTLGSRLAISAVLSALSVFFTAYGSMGWSFLPQGTNVAVTAYILLALLLITAFMAVDVFSDALHRLKKMEFSISLMVGSAVLAVTIDTFFAADSGRVPFCTPAGLLILILLWDKYDGIIGVLTTLRVLRGAKQPTGIVEVHDVMKGHMGLSRAKGSVDDFMEHYEQTPPTERLTRIYVPIALAICITVSAVITAKSGSPFLWTLSLLLLGSIPIVGILNYSRLFCLLAKRLSDSDAALCGWYGAQTFGGEHTILISDNDLFPETQIKLNGIKVVAKNADRVIAYAAATAKAADSALYPLFEEELQSRNARRYNVERYRFYESGGIGAEIAGDIVLMGTLDFMRHMGVHMEGGMRLKQAMYTAVNGELAAVFAIKYTPKEATRRGLAAISENRHFRSVFVTRDFLLTPERIRDKYEISLNNVIYPPAKERIRLSETELKQKGKQGALMIDDSFGSFADAVSGGRVLKSAVNLSMLLTLLNGLIGIVLMAVLAFQGGMEAATAANLLIYQAAWMIPTLLLTGWTRRF